MSKFVSRITALLAGVMLLTGSLTGCAAPAGEPAPPLASSSSAAVEAPFSFINPITPPNLEAVRPLEAPDAQVLSQIRDKQTINSDVVAWLDIPGTDINDEVLQHPENNDFYIKSDITKAANFYGCFYADFECAIGNRNTISKNTILYGHNMDDNPNGLRFAQLKRFEDPAFAAAHPYIHLSTPDDTLTYQIFAVSYSDMYLPFFYPNKTGQAFMKVVNDLRDRSIFNYEVHVDSNDKILILSTCTYKYGKKNSEQRFVVVGRLLREGEAADAQTVNLARNPEPVQPSFRNFKEQAAPYVAKAAEEAARLAAEEQNPLEPV